MCENHAVGHLGIQPCHLELHYNHLELHFNHLELHYNQRFNMASIDTGLI